MFLGFPRLSSDFENENFQNSEIWDFNPGPGKEAGEPGSLRQKFNIQKFNINNFKRRFISMHKKTYRTQGEWAVYEVDRWMDRLERKRTLALDWNTEFWAAGGSRGNAPKQFIAGQSATQVQCAGLSSPSGEHIGPEEIRELIKKKTARLSKTSFCNFLF